MYQVGEFIIYGGTGVCRVEEVSTPSFSSDKNRLYYKLKPMYQDGSIYTPTDNSKVFMRPILSKEEVLELIDKIPSIQAPVYESHVLRELTQHYESALQTHDCSQLLALTISIHAKSETAQAEKKRLGSVDARYWKRAQELLFGELATALQIPRESVPAFIADRLGDTEEGSK